MKKLIITTTFLCLLVGCKTPASTDTNSSNFLSEFTQRKMPLLTKKENPMLAFQLPSEIKSIHSISLDILTTEKLSDLSELSFYYSADGKFKNAQKLITTDKISSKIKVSFPSISLQGGTLFVTAKTNEHPNLLNKVWIQKLVLSDEKKSFFIKPSKENQPQRMGITLREKHQDNIDTYRIPGLATTNKGTLIAVYDNRYDSSVDLQGNINVGMSRSTDGGQSWEPMKEIMDMGTYGGKAEDENGIGDPAVLVDRATNTIWVAALWQHGDKGKRAWWASKPGLLPEETAQLILVKSEDDGVTWSEPINITSQMKDPKWYLFFDGPGKGITLEDGTLMFAAQFKDENQVPHSTVIYSKDHGKTWQVGTGAQSHTTEAQVVQLSNGDIMLNMRDDRNRPNGNLSDGKFARATYTSSDLGKTWTEHPTSRKGLRASNCMASIIKVEKKGKSPLYFFSNPDVTHGRNHISIKVSDDEAMTWDKYPTQLLHEDNTYGYSCLTLIDDKHIGILYEGSGDMYFQKIPIADFEISN